MSFHNPNDNAKGARKFLVSVFIFSIIFSGLFGIANFKAQTAEAVAPDPGVPVGGVPLFSIMSNTITQVQKELTLDAIVTVASKIMIQSVTNAVVNWINSGFEGSPAFVTDPTRFLTDVGDQVAGDFIENTDSGLSFLCEPFALDIRLALNLNYSSTFVDEINCRLSDAISNVDNFTKFTAGDFSQGGWASWFEISQNPQNNPLGALLISQNELAIQIATAQGTEQKKLDWGDGFLSFRECIQMDQNQKCTKHGDIQTPGTVINDQLGETLGTGFRQLELADEINEVVGALIGQLVQTVLTEGLSSFSSSGSNSGSLNTPLSVTCSPNNTISDVGENITWTASVFGGNPGSPRFIWSGDDQLSGNSPSVNIRYTITGLKSASVRVTKGGETVTQSCLSNVSVQDGPITGTLDVLCYADKSTADVGENVTWSATAIAPANDTAPVTYNWSGSDPITGRSTSDVTLAYNTSGVKTASVTITKSGQTASRTCNQEVTIADLPLSASCAPESATGTVGQPVRWITTVVGGGQQTAAFRWTGSSPISSVRTQNAEVRYTNTGEKVATVRVTKDGQSVSTRCVPNVQINP